MKRFFLGLLRLTIIIFCIVFYLNYNESPTKEKENDNKELIDKWTKPTVDFFSTFSCDNLKRYDKSHKINKFFVIESHLNHPYKLSIYSKTDSVFSNTRYINRSYTKNISKANTIIWIQSVPGLKEGHYTDGSAARRLSAEINFIDKRNNMIYKQVKTKFLGEPRDKIKVYGRNKMGGTVYFGKKPYEEIFKIIQNEL